MRALIYQAIVAAGTDVADRVYPAGSLGVGDIPAEPVRPYIQWSYDSETPYAEVAETGGTLRHMLRIFVYDERGDFTRIDAVHKALRHTIKGLTGQVSPSGTQCTEARFLNLGGDLTDNVRNLGVKQASYRIVAQ